MTTPAMPELSRGQIIDLISPQSKNSADHDIEFAHRVIAALRPAQQAVPMTEAERAEVFRKAEARMVYDLELSWRDAVVKETEAHHGITAQGAQEGV